MILVIGKNGFLGKCLARQPQTAALRFVGHDALGEDGLLDGVDSVINLAVDPRYMSLPYDASYDFELAVGRLVAKRNIHYVMASSRKVYSPDALLPAVEDSATTGIDDYGRNKKITEEALRNVLGERLSVVRLANVVGFDLQWGRPTVMARMLASLKTDVRVTLDLSPFARRDFITDDAVARTMIRLATSRTGGTFNLGSGEATPIGKVAMWLIEGYGRGELVITSPAIRDEFVLDVTKLTTILGPLCPVEQIRAACLAAGRELARV